MSLMFLQPLINMGLNRPGWNPSGGANFAKLLQNQKTQNCSSVKTLCQKTDGWLVSHRSG